MRSVAKPHSIAIGMDRSDFLESRTAYAGRKHCCRCIDSWKSRLRRRCCSAHNTFVCFFALSCLAPVVVVRPFRVVDSWCMTLKCPVHPKSNDAVRGVVCAEMSFNSKISMEFKQSLLQKGLLSFLYSRSLKVLRLDRLLLTLGAVVELSMLTSWVQGGQRDPGLLREHTYRSRLHEVLKSCLC